MGINIHVKVECELKPNETLMFDLDKVVNIWISALHGFIFRYH